MDEAFYSAADDWEELEQTREGEELPEEPEPVRTPNEVILRLSDEHRKFLSELYGRVDAAAEVGAIPCSEVGLGVYYPESYTAQGREVAMAIKLCEGCPLQAACLAIALTFEHPGGKGQRHGIWGGLTPRRRGKILGELGNKPTPRAINQCAELLTGKKTRVSEERLAELSGNATKNSR